MVSRHSMPSGSSQKECRTVLLLTGSASLLLIFILVVEHFEKCFFSIIVEIYYCLVAILIYACLSVLFICASRRLTNLQTLNKNWQAEDITAYGR